MHCFLALLFTVLAFPRAPEARPAAANAEPINANDNRTAAGSLQNGVLTVTLELRPGAWYPDGRDKPGVQLYAFAEPGRPLQIPGPLLRVPEGTVIRASIRNTLTDSTLVLHGLYTRDGTARAAGDTIRVAPGSTRAVSFPAGQAGTYYYWGTTNSVPNWLVPHTNRDSQLSGALIIDPRASSGAPRDRILFIGVWSSVPIVELNDGTDVVTRFVINGTTWPGTERLQYTLGDSIRFRLINASTAVHPMHLHGFYFTVNSRGAEDIDQQQPAGAAPDIAVTERLAQGRTAMITWVPERPGNWLFHCHDNLHIQPGRPFPAAVAASSAAPASPNSHAHGQMGGLVVGVEVRPRPGEALTASEPERRKLRLSARAHPGSTPTEPSYGFQLQSAGFSSATATSPGPAIVLQRGQPVSITVVNELSEPTSVHWHGIELESYYDGVAGFAGQGARIAPLIAPRDSFEARFTPPRAGTFIYHTHVDEVRQQRAGLAGPLLVLEPGSRYDPATDIVLLLHTPRLNDDRSVIMLNGSTKPPPIELRAGTRYRLRVINIHTYRPNLRLDLKQDSTVLSWRALAKDGAALPSERATERPATLVIGNGETYDFEFTPARAGDLTLVVNRAAGGLLVTQPIRVH